ncbi:O-antigen ligase [Candidatus Cyanaurora vandensis]|uniref:O-antigen ligase family protein n=1 Tax=Candidatus Cyanaurora vandensis TaxID=2714958 RepID=UPI00257AAF9A|nr:O-antigen ligase family protein [Candidatus Cyanaurora vandensis]
MTNAQFTWPTLQPKDLILVLICALVGVGVAVVAGLKPILVALAVVGVLGAAFIVMQFELAVLTLLVMRSSLDILTTAQIPAALALVIDGVALLYLFFTLLQRKPVQGDWFLWVFAGWVLLMGCWPLFAGLGFFDSYLVADEAFREWTRMLSLVLIYFLVMQLKDKVSPRQLLSYLLLALVIPLGVGLVEVFTVRGRIASTLTHPDALADFLVIFVGLLIWHYRQTKQRRWLLLLVPAGVVFFKTGALTGFVMMLGFLAVYALFTLKPRNLLFGAAAVVVFLGVFFSTEVGQRRLDKLQNTPLFNSTLSFSSAANLPEGNSFNWRLSQWTFLVVAWQKAPVLGYGLRTADEVSPYGISAHNVYLMMLVETGVVGFTLFLGLLGAIAARLTQLWRQALPGSDQRELCQVLIAVFAGLLVAMIADNVWNYTTFWFYWWTMLAVAGWHWPKTAPLLVQRAAKSDRKLLFTSSPK